MPGFFPKAPRSFTLIQEVGMLEIIGKFLAIALAFCLMRIVFQRMKDAEDENEGGGQ